MDRTQPTTSLPAERMRVINVQAEARAQLAGALAESCTGSGPDWPTKMIAAIEASLHFAAEAPEEARLLLLDAVVIDPALGVGAQQTQDFLTTLLVRGREHCVDAAAMPELTERALVGAATSLVGTRLINGEAAELPMLRQPLVQLLLTPYVGRERARQLSLGQ